MIAVILIADSSHSAPLGSAVINRLGRYVMAQDLHFDEISPNRGGRRVTRTLKAGQWFAD